MDDKIATASAFRPDGVVEFQVSETRARNAVQRWLGSVPLAPNRLAEDARIEQLEALYLPYYAVTARGHASWMAQRETDESVRRTPAYGKTKKNFQFEPASGQLDHEFRSLAVCGTSGSFVGWLGALVPGSLGDVAVSAPHERASARIAPATVDADAATARATGAIEAACLKLCDKAVGRTHKDLKVTTQISDLQVRRLLVPVWLVRYRYGKTEYQAVVGGLDPKVEGDSPGSVLKIAALSLLAVGVGLLLLGILYLQYC